MVKEVVGDTKAPRIASRMVKKWLRKINQAKDIHTAQTSPEKIPQYSFLQIEDFHIPSEVWILRRNLLE